MHASLLWKEIVDSRTDTIAPRTESLIPNLACLGTFVITVNNRNSFKKDLDRLNDDSTNQLCLELCILRITITTRDWTFWAQGFELTKWKNIKDVKQCSKSFTWSNENLDPKWEHSVQSENVDLAAIWNACETSIPEKPIWESLEWFERVAISLETVFGTLVNNLPCNSSFSALDKTFSLPCLPLCKQQCQIPGFIIFHFQHWSSEKICK
mmetsp:Transcript_33871/g.51956  ORF Transcript_33871/g.51956 Transcript_33871/m.51956 type:complete len:210 (+) Transcript_33871:161-790(+)